VVPGVGNEDLVFAVAGDVPGVVELAGPVPFRTEARQILAGQSENLKRAIAANKRVSTRIVI
jgi:hypothetical protein